VSPLRGSLPFTKHWKHLRAERTDSIATATLTRPGKVNAAQIAGPAIADDYEVLDGFAGALV
jgi:hypothetical protein